MQIGGNPEELQALARRLRGWSGEVGATGDRIRAGAGVQWVSTSADRFRARLAEHASAVEAARDELSRAADLLVTLADELAERQAAIRRAAALVEDAVDEAGRSLRRLWGVAQDELSEVERATSEGAQRVLAAVGDGLPLPGAPDWLALRRKLEG